MLHYILYTHDSYSVNSGNYWMQFIKRSINEKLEDSGKGILSVSQEASHGDTLKSIMVQGLPQRLERFKS